MRIEGLGLGPSEVQVNIAMILALPYGDVSLAWVKDVIADCGLFIAHYGLFIAHYGLFIAHYDLFIYGLFIALARLRRCRVGTDTSCRSNRTWGPGESPMLRLPFG